LLCESKRFAHALAGAAEIGLKEHDRLALAQQLMERRLSGRQPSFKLPELVGLFMAKPLTSVSMAETLEVTPQASPRIVRSSGSYSGQL
jgi:hypothetical protein